jgi:sugar-specific transcriptional regulator TrmB
MLRASLVAKIYDVLEKSPFTVSDFVVDLPEKDGEQLLLIGFRHDQRFAFELNQRFTEDGYVYSVTMAPGEFKKTEEEVVQSLSAVPDFIKAWARNVRDELRASIPIYSELDEIRELIEKHISENVKEPESRFSAAEVDDLRSKLDMLAARFDELQQRNEITEQQLNRLNQELTSLKSNLSSFPKGTWYKTAGAKLYATVNAIITSKESRQILAQQAKKALGLDDGTP